MGDSTQRVRIGDARQKMSEFGTPTAQSKARFDEIIGRFEKFAQRGFDVEFIDQVTPELVEQFVRAKGSSGEPSTATMHVRRASLRLLFRIARFELDCEGDPTLDLVLPTRTMLSARPLTEEEVVLGRSYSLHTFGVTRQPAAWALGEATATTGELPHITTDDLDLDCAQGPRVWLHGSNKRVDRWGLLDDWGATQLERRAKALVDTDRLIYAGNGSVFTAQISACNVITETLVRCGLEAEADVKPASLPAWAGVVALEETGTIDGAARRLGIRSLDAAARFINFDWK